MLLNRPLVFLFLCLSFGLFLGHIYGTTNIHPLLIIVAIILSSTSIVFKNNKSQTKTILLGMSIIALGLNLYPGSYFSTDQCNKYFSGTHKIIGKISSYPLKTGDKVKINFKFIYKS